MQRSLTAGRPSAGPAGRLARVALPGCVAAAVLLALGRDTTGFPPVAGVAAHAGLFLLALLLAGESDRRCRRAAWAFGGASVLLALAGFWPGVNSGVRQVLVPGHTLMGGAAVVALAVGWLLPRVASRRVSRTAWVALVTGAFVPLLVVLALDRSRAGWDPPRYDAAACYRFLTATTAGQAGEAAFPSALRPAAAGTGCTTGGCHRDAHREWAGQAHAASGSRPGYVAALREFTGRRGADAARWCRGCHEPGTLRPAATLPLSGVRGIDCAACHDTKAVHALYGSAPLELRAGQAATTAAFEPLLRPSAHASRHLRPALITSAEFCGACHRKNWSLPQNGYRWMPGPDEYRDWQGSRFSGSALFAPGAPEAARTCVGCHDPHGPDPPRPALELDVFLRSMSGRQEAVELLEAATRAGARYLDVVVVNSGIGHDFPTGMPDIRDAWLEVTLHDGAGGVVAASGTEGASGARDPRAHGYRLVALDRRGRPVRHGALDEMAAVREWRRIPAGGADLARYRVPPGFARARRVVVRLLRRRTPEFTSWAGERPDPIEELASMTVDLPRGGPNSRPIRTPNAEGEDEDEDEPNAQRPTPNARRRKMAPIRHGTGRRAQLSGGHPGVPPGAGGRGGRSRDPPRAGPAAPGRGGPARRAGRVRADRRGGGAGPGVAGGSPAADGAA